MNVRECMKVHPISVSPEENAAAAARLMTRYNVGALPVQAWDGSLCGIVTDRDLILRCMALDRSPQETTVAAIMTSGVRAVHPEDSVEQAASQMASRQVRRLPVVEGRKLVGMVSLSDVSKVTDTGKAFQEITANVRHL